MGSDIILKIIWYMKFYQKVNKNIILSSWHLKFLVQTNSIKKVYQIKKYKKKLNIKYLDIVTTMVNRYVLHI